MMDLGIPIFNDEMENAVAPFIQTDGKFTSEKWESLKKRFIRHYRFREIGFETIELFRSYWIDVFEDEIERFLNLWNTNIDDKLSNSTSNLERELNNADLPFTPLQNVDEYSSYKTTEKVKSSGISGKSQMEQLETYNKHYQDIDNQFIMVFNDLFMGVYEV